MHYRLNVNGSYICCEHYVSLPEESDGLCMRYEQLFGVVAALLAASYVAPVPASATTGMVSGPVKLLKVQDTGVGNTFFTLDSSTAVGR
ncbi:MAG: hypothetical protein RL701_1830, partial [Pseudomonadota bacterium]